MHQPDPGTLPTEPTTTVHCQDLTSYNREICLPWLHTVYLDQGQHKPSYGPCKLSFWQAPSHCEDSPRFKSKNEAEGLPCSCIALTSIRI